MDTLPIDLRELLSTPDVDETSPLSAPDLRLLIDRLQIRSLRIKDKVRSYVLAHRHDFAESFSRCSSASSGSEELSRSLLDALRLLSDGDDGLGGIRGLVDEIRDKRRELEECRETLAIVRTASTLHEGVESARNDLNAGRFVEAATALRDLKDETGDGGVDEPAVFGFLRDKWKDCFDELQEVLAKSLERFIEFKTEGGSVSIRKSFGGKYPNKVELRQVIEAMEVLGVLDYGLSRIADLMIKYVILPAITNRSVDIFIKETQGLSKEIDVSLNMVTSSDIQEGLAGEALYSHLRQIVNFMYKFICFENGSWMRCLGRLTWPRMSDLIIAHFLSKAVPDDASKIANFQNVMKQSAEFENCLKEMTFISRSDVNEEKLSHFTHNVEVHFASRKRNELLARARQHLLHFSYDLSSASDGVEASSNYVVDLLFQSDKLIISKTVSQLMRLVHEALKDACLSPTRVAKEFYHAARDVLLLYKAIIPVKLEKQMDDVGQVAVIVHNDCYYLSQEILGLSYEYRADFPSGLQKQMVFVDIALSFHQMAENILQKQAQLVFGSLKQAIDGADGFQNTHQSHNYELARFSIEQVVFILEKVHIMWEPLMPVSIYKKTMCALLDSIFSRITTDMLLLDDMAAEETLELQKLIQMALENLSSLFASLITDVDEKQRFLNNNTSVWLDKMIPSLCKFRTLADLYDMPLKSITSLWEGGELLSCGFTSSEVDNFIKAVFTDSPLRKECLWRIGARG